MRLKIRDAMLLSEVKSKFNECLPGLQLEFYRNQRTLKLGEPAPDHYTIGDLLKRYESDEIEIMSWFRAGRVAADFKHLYGLLAQVFREEPGGVRSLDEDEQLVPVQQHIQHVHQPSADETH